MIQFYQLLHEKYALSFKDIHIHLQRAKTIGLPDPGKLLDALDNSDRYHLLNAILDYLGELKEVILTPGELKIMENIYYKRHIAVDIPSMYGSYNEPRFDALGLTFRLENLANVIFEEIILSINLSFITRATFHRIARFIPLFMKALEIDGITSSRLESQKELFMKALEVPRFSHSQYMDIFRGFSEAIKQIIQTHYDSVHDENLELIIKQLGPDKLIQRYQRDGEVAAERIQRVSESFLRDLIARTFGLQYFDHFIASILTTLATQREELSVHDLDLMLSYDPGRTVSHLYHPNSETLRFHIHGEQGAHTGQSAFDGDQGPARLRHNYGVFPVQACDREFLAIPGGFRRTGDGNGGASGGRNGPQIRPSRQPASFLGAERLGGFDARNDEHLSQRGNQ